MTWREVLETEHGLSFTSRKRAEERESAVRKLAADYIAHFRYLAQHGETAAVRELAETQLAEYFEVLSDTEPLNH